MSDFTKGKWKVDAHTIRVSCRVFRSVKTGDVEYGNIAIIPTIHGMSEQEALANACLIAAAPEMYGELYEALQLCEGKSSYDGDEFASQAKSIRELLARIDRPADVET